MEPLYTLVVCLGPALERMPAVTPVVQATLMSAQECTELQNTTDVTQYRNVHSISFCQRMNEDGTIKTQACLGPHPKDTIAGEVRHYP